MIIRFYIFLGKLLSLYDMKSKTVTKDLVSESLIDWYRYHHRIMPWREHVTPYRVWISEIMLQQTRIETVIRYFETFMTAFPTIQAVADADLEKVYAVWAGLGYYQRAKNIWKTAQILMNQYDATLPNQYSQLITLPGIGEYTACAILSIAYHQPFPAVDGNVLRVVTRLKGWKENVLEKQTVRHVSVFLKSIVPAQYCSEFTQAWMELGETLCTKQTPLCDRCPLSIGCYAKQHNVTNELPVRIKDLKRSEETRAVFLIQPSPKCLVITKKKKGLLAELWELPNMELATSQAGKNPKTMHYSGLQETFSYVSSLKHDFTHKRWHLHVYQGKMNPGTPIDPDWLIISWEELEKYPMATAFKKVITLLF